MKKKERKHIEYGIREPNKIKKQINIDCLYIYVLCIYFTFLR